MPETTNLNPIQGVPTAITGFIGSAADGPVNEPVSISSFSDYERTFGGLSSESTMSYSVRQFFLNGGRKAVIVRLVKPRKGTAISFAEIANPLLKSKQQGLWAFDAADMINILCIPPFSFLIDVDQRTWKSAVDYCRTRHAFLIVDPPSTWKMAKDVNKILEDENAALYFPRITCLDPLNGNLPRDFAPCGAVAGVISRTDEQRGVWKAPAGPQANLHGVTGLSVSLSDVDYRSLNLSGVNCLRSMAPHEFVVWGTRTLCTASSTSEWKYVPVRRLGLYIEESLSRGLKWTAFEPNDEQLWGNIRRTVGDFMHNLFLQGAFQGDAPQDAYFVRCNGEPTTGNNIHLDVVKIIVGFAPRSPAEFLAIKIQ